MSAFGNDVVCSCSNESSMGGEQEDCGEAKVTECALNDEKHQQDQSCLDICRREDSDQSESCIIGSSNDVIDGNEVSTDIGEDEGYSSLNDSGFECSICTEVFHNPVSLLPCLHCFCAGCISQWILRRNSKCPLCRTECSVICRNHLLEIDCEAYLAKNPSKERAGGDIRLLDNFNVITEDVECVPGLTSRQQTTHDFISIYANNRAQALQMANVLVPMGVRPSSIHYQTVDSFGHIMRTTL